MRVLAFDTETALIAPGRKAPPLACVTWARAGGGAGIDNPDAGWRRMRDALKDPSTYVVGANVFFDLGVLVQHNPDILPLVFQALDAGRIGCTALLSQLQFVAGHQTRPSHDLATLSELWLGMKITGKKKGDAWRFHYRKLMHLPVKAWPARAREYATLDAVRCLDVWQAQQAKLVPDLDAQMRGAWALYVMEAWGFQVDAPRVYALDKKLRPPVEAVRAELTKLGIYRADGSKDEAFVKALVTKAFNGAPPLTDAGNVRIAEDVLVDSGDPVLAKLASIAKNEKELSAFLPMLLEAARTGLPVCPRWNALVRTGRTSCRGPNAQQFPRRSGVRECVIPRPGWMFFGADYSIAESRSLAQVLYTLFGHSPMRDALNAGQDLHVLTGGRIIGLDYETALARFNAGDAEMIEMRQLAKACNFGYPGGLGAEAFVGYAAGYGVVITPARSAELRQLWLQTFPEMRDYFSWISRKVSSGFATFEQPYSGRLRGRVGYTDGCNTMFQGLTADGAKRALYEVTRRQLCDRSSALYGTRLNLFVHDELVAEGPEEQAPEAGDELATVMVEQMNVVTPDVASEADPYLMRRWTKGAKTLRDQYGRLQCAA
jgi:hypothetical protein